MNSLEKFKKEMQEATGIIMPTITRDGNEVVYSKECKVIKTPYELRITLPEYVRLLANKHIQDVLPHKTPEEREFIISGTTPAEWNDMFGDNTKE